MILTNAILSFDGDPIAIPDPTCIKDFSVDHSLANADCTRVELDNGTIFRVQESVEEISAVISADKMENRKSLSHSRRLIAGMAHSKVNPTPETKAWLVCFHQTQSHQ